MIRRTLLALALAAALSTARPAAQSCTFGDGLDGGTCCSPAQANLPNIKGFTQNFLQVCWLDCNVDQINSFTAKWVPIAVIPGTHPPCDELRMRLDVLGPGNVLWWRGPMRLQYSRTWFATAVSGMPTQVWRFLVNGDLRPTLAVPSTSCHLPTCAAPNGNRVSFSGYLDFAQGCVIPGGGLEQAWMLTHACDALDHHAGFARAGTFHPGRSWSFVAPALGFVPGPLQPLEGTAFSPFEAVRGKSVLPPNAVLCNFEEPAVHSLLQNSQGCFCGLPGSNQFLYADLHLQTACGTSLTTPLVGPFIPGFVSMGLGSWTNPNAYPGLQSLRWNVGGYDRVDPCAGTPRHELYYGVTTIGGYPANQLVGGTVGTPLPMTFIDQASSTGLNGLPKMNVPFRSFHVVNLNH